MQQISISGEPIALLSKWIKIYLVNGVTDLPFEQLDPVSSQCTLLVVLEYIWNPAWGSCSKVRFADFVLVETL